MYLTFQMVGNGGLLKRRVTLKRKITHRGELFFVWSLHSEDFSTGRSRAVWPRGLLYDNGIILSFGLIKWEMIHCLDHRSSSRPQTLLILCRAFFSLFSSTSQVLPTVAVENTFVFVRPILVSDWNLTSDRWVSAHTVIYVCVFVRRSVCILAHL